MRPDAVHAPVPPRVRRGVAHAEGNVPCLSPRPRRCMSDRDDLSAATTTICTWCFSPSLSLSLPSITSSNGPPVACTFHACPHRVALAFCSALSCKVVGQSHGRLAPGGLGHDLARLHSLHRPPSQDALLAPTSPSLSTHARTSAATPCAPRTWHTRRHSELGSGGGGVEGRCTGAWWSRSREGRRGSSQSVWDRRSARGAHQRACSSR